MDRARLGAGAPGWQSGTQRGSHSREWLQRVGRKVRVGRAGALRWPLRSLPPPISMILGSRSHTGFLCQCSAPTPGGAGRPAAGLLAGDAWVAEPGISLQALTVSFLCCFLPVPTPYLCKSPGILLSPAVLRAKALGKEIDRAFPHQGCSAGTLNASLSLASQTPSPPGERRRWAVCWSASPRLVQAGWGPLSCELFTLQSCGILIHLKSRPVLNAFSKDFGTEPAAGGTTWKNSP